MPVETRKSQKLSDRALGLYPKAQTPEVLNFKLGFSSQYFVI
jgi:hypothetical protein